MAGRSGALVLDLPGVVEDVPGRAPDHIPGRPRPAGSSGAQRGGKRPALLAPRRTRWHPDPGLGAAEGPLGPADVVGDRGRRRAGPCAAPRAPPPRPDPGNPSTPRAAPSDGRPRQDPAARLPPGPSHT